MYVLDENTALVQTTDFFPAHRGRSVPVRTDRGCQRLSDVYAMGGEPKLALNIMCLAQSMDDHAVQEILRGGYDKAYEAGAIITGGHTIQGAEPIYGLAVSGFVHPKKVLTQQRRKAGGRADSDQAARRWRADHSSKSGSGRKSVLDRIYRQMAALNKAARDVMVKYPVHSCTDVTGFRCSATALRWHRAAAFPMHLRADDVPYHAEAYPLAEMGLIPAGAYRNRQYAGSRRMSIRVRFREPCRICFTTRRPAAACCFCRSRTRKAVWMSCSRACRRRRSSGMLPKTGVFDLFGVNIKLRDGKLTR